MTAALIINSSSSTLTSTSSASPLNDESCYYCSHTTLLRDAIPPKRCDYCRAWKCQFCTLKFPLINVKKKVLPKIMKGNSRICVQCFSQHWQANGLSSASQDKRSKRSSSTDLDARESFVIDSSRPSSFVFDSGRTRDSLTFDSNRRESMAIDSMWAGKDSFDESTRLSFMDAPDEKEAVRQSFRSRSHSSSAALDPVADDAQIAQNLISAVDLWISIFAATILVVIVVLEGYSLQQRVCYCVATYGVFLTLHPWFHKPQSTAAPDAAVSSQSQTSSKASSGVAPQTTTSAASQMVPRMPSVAEGDEPRALGAFPDSYRRQKAEMEKNLKHYLSDECAWKVIKTTSGGIVSEMTANDSPFPLFKIELFITGAPMSKFVDFLDSKDVKDRGLWDLNVADFAMIETFPEEPNVSVCHNTQKSFLGGLVAARDFCLLYVRDDNCISFSSVEHPGVPVSPNATRGNVLLSCFHCHEAIGEDGTPGFILTYICQVDIGGSLPPKLLYNGSVDNMVKMIKVFKNPKKLLR